MNTNPVSSTQWLVEDVAEPAAWNVGPQYGLPPSVLTVILLTEQLPPHTNAHEQKPVSHPRPYAVPFWMRVHAALFPHQGRYAWNSTPQEALRLGETVPEQGRG